MGVSFRSLGSLDLWARTSEIFLPLPLTCLPRVKTVKQLSVKSLIYRESTINDIVSSLLKGAHYKKGLPKNSKKLTLR